MTKRAIDGLIRDTKAGVHSPLSARVPPDIMKAVEVDLRAVVEAGLKGVPIPSATRLRKFFLDEYDVRISETTIRNRLATIRENK